jgi:3-oxoacyl-[acyl-carrier protein] reductase
MNIVVVGAGPLATACREAAIASGHQLIDGPEGPVDAVIFSPWNPANATPCPLTDLTDDEFGAAWQHTMDAATATCVAARERMLGHGGTIVLTAPTIGQSGANQYAHWSAAAEGVRVLAKSAARQWGSEGITVNAIAISPTLALADPALAGTTSLAAPALPTSAADTAAFIVAFCGLPLSVTGQTIASDGGVWMS